MRIPLTKAYRAFEEFDRLPDEECERYMRGVAADGPWQVSLLPTIGLAMAIVGWPLAVYFGWSWVPRGIRELADFRLESGILFGSIMGVVSWVFVSAAVYWLLRDWGLWYALREQIARVRCPKCKYSLLGIPITHRNLGLPVPGDAWIRCPECGKRQNLLEVGITPRDLIPMEERVVAPDIGAFKASGARRAAVQVPADDDERWS